MKLKRFSLLREHLALKFDSIERQLEECLAIKESHDKFSYTDLDIVEIASYSLCTFSSVADVVKDKQDIKFTMLKQKFGDCFTQISIQ